MGRWSSIHPVLIFVFVFVLHRVEGDFDDEIQSQFQIVQPMAVDAVLKVLSTKSSINRNLISIIHSIPR